ncbi:NAD(P)H-binding protein [Streptomyces cinereoruber]|uniref:NAD(P)H-binding protein n=1 Tax=Streptomyces cinereoruber TaxID=67260 RepID=UPI003C2C0C8F
MSPAGALSGPKSGPKVVVTGATGAVGRHVAHRLAAGGTPPTLLVRDPAKAAAFGLPGAGPAAHGAAAPATVVRGDYADTDRLRAVLEGADALFVVTANPLRPRDDENLLAAARAAGVRHAVKLSWLGVADPGADDLVADWNRGAEDRLRSSGLTWTVLRIRTPMSNALAWAPSVRERGVVRAFGGAARTGCVDPRDVAEVAARALTDPAGHASATYALTGPQLLSAREQTAVLSEVLGVRIGFEELTAEEARAGWSARYGDRIADALLAAARRRADGAAGGDDGTLERLLGRTPGTFAGWAADHAEPFRPACRRAPEDTPRVPSGASGPDGP